MEVITIGSHIVLANSYLISIAVTIIAPKIAGIASKKENFAASLFETPEINAAEIVIPEREMPGMIAQA